MARSLSRALCIALLCGAALPAAADCVIDANGEITNPFEPGCGNVVFTYTENDNLGTNIALGYPPPAPVASMTAGRRLSRLRLAFRTAPVAAHAERRGGRRGRRRDACRPRHLGLRDRRSGFDDGGGFSRSRGADQRRHPCARMADARSRDFTLRDAGCRQGGRRIFPVSRRQPEHDRRARKQRGRLHPDPALSRNGHRRSRAAARRAHAAEEPAQPRDERIHRFRHRDGRGQFLGRRPQPQLFAGLRPARPQQHEPDQPRLSRRRGRIPSRNCSRCSRRRRSGRRRASGSSATRIPSARTISRRNPATRGSTRSRRRSPRA